VYTADIRLCENILTFKRHLKTHLFKLASVSSDLKALYKSVIIIIIIYYYYYHWWSGGRLFDSQLDRMTDVRSSVCVLHSSEIVDVL